MTAVPARKDFIDPRLITHRYKNPPVVEALVDIHVRVGQSVPIETLRLIRSGEEDRYPTEQHFIARSITVDVATGATTESHQEPKGYRFISATQQEIVQARTDGFAFSRLPPYTGWDQWKPEAERLWQKYVELTNPVAVTRVAVRYVNRIDIEFPAEPLRNYLTTYPHLGEKLPQQVGHFVMQVSLPQADMPGVTFNISQGRLLNPSDQRASILLDLDLFRVGDISPRSSELWSWLETLHAEENALFEGCITDRARELFNS
jgi:uncharacterized protein (TIGR04255 family)